MIPLEATGSDGRAVFHSNMSLHKPKLFDNQNISENEQLSSMMQYVLCVSRFAQYLKVILRDKLGSFTEAPQAEKFLSDWVHQYVSPDDQASDETRAKMPLRAAEIEVQDDPGSGGTMKVVMRLQPHFQIDRIDSTLRLISAVHYDPNKMSSRRG
jgi:type VI secretion system protein ImpD